jgi:hypothetical protein
MKLSVKRKPSEEISISANKYPRNGVARRQSESRNRRKVACNISREKPESSMTNINISKARGGKSANES